MTASSRNASFLFRPKNYWLAAVFGFLVLWRILLPEQTLDAVGPRALLDFAFSLIFCAALAALCLGLGLFAQRFIPLAEISFGEKWILAMVGGAGIAGTLLGAAGMLAGASSELVKAYLIVLSVPAGVGWAEEGEELTKYAGRWRGLLRSLQLTDALILLAASLILLTCLLRAFAPPWDPDGLIYHLEAPRQFLSAGRVISLSDNAPANYPLLIEMLYMAGMAFGSDTAARILHVGWFALLLLMTFLFARRLFDGRVARIAVVILLGIPILPFWSTLAHTDIAWAVFELSAVSVLLLILKGGKRTEEIFWCGLFAGFAMASKYLALGTAVWSAAWILIAVLRRRRDRFMPMMTFCLAAAAPLLPWLVKNWAGFGNPFYPLAFEPFSAGAEQRIWMDYMQNGFGAGRTLGDYLMLPINMYIRHADFSTVGGTIEIPSLLFPLAVILPFTRPDPNARHLGGFALYRAAFWAIGAQQIRMLLPLFPILSILAALVVRWIAERMQEGFLYRVFSHALLGGMLAAAMLYQIIDLLQTKPWLPAAGIQSKAEWLAQQVSDFGAVQFIREALPVGAKVMMLWDGRGYYCDSRCIPDTLHAQWTARVDGGGDPAEVALSLQSEGFTHLLVSETDIAFLLNHDPGGAQAKAWAFLVKEFLPSCAELVYSDNLARVYRIGCAEMAGGRYRGGGWTTRTESRFDAGCVRQGNNTMRKREFVGRAPGEKGCSPMVQSSMSDGAVFYWVSKPLPKAVCGMRRVRRNRNGKIILEIRSSWKR